MTESWVWATTRLQACSREDGQDMVEYALLCGLISIVALAMVYLLGPYIKNTFQDLINAINSA